MEIQVEHGTIDGSQNLVLHIHVTFQTLTSNINSFVGHIYEGYPAFQSDNTVPLLVCHGKGDTEFEATLACLDLLLGYNYPKGIRHQMEKWILQNQNMQTAGCSLYLQIRYEGKLQNVRIDPVGIPKFSKYFPGSYTSTLVR